jgi:TonB family protein
VVLGVVACESRLPTEDPGIQEAKLVQNETVRDSSLYQTTLDNAPQTVQLRKRVPMAGDSEYVLTLEKKLHEGSLMRVSTDKPSFTPYTDMPQLQNREEVSAQLGKMYPPLLKGAGVGGKTLYWALVDIDGRIVSAKVSQSSGQLALDKAGREVLESMKFSPALNHGAKVPVWIQLPIVFDPK